MSNIITLLTDFGLEDPYVGLMHGVIYTINPEAKLVDLTHSIQPQRVEQGAFLLSTSYRYFPPSTVHLVVIDPGVGTSRRAIAVQIQEVGTFVGPDNGIFWQIIENEFAKGAAISCVELANPEYRLSQVSSTFHGRDIFAPAAAYLSKGVPLEKLGPIISRYHLVMQASEVPQWQIETSRKGKSLLRVQGHIMHIDHFGNLITNLPVSLLSELTEHQQQVLWLDAYQFRIMGLSRTYGYTTSTAYTSTAMGTIKKDNLIGLISSSGYVEIAIPNGNAAQEVNAKIGDSVTLTIPAS